MSPRAAWPLLVIAACLCSQATSAVVGINIKDDVGAIHWGKNQDVNLYRNLTSLKTDNDFAVAGNLYLGNTGMNVATILTSLSTLSQNVLSAQTINVGNARTYTKLQFALNFVANKLFLGPVVIQIDANSYSLASPIIVQNLLSPQLLSIVGNINSPSSVAFQCQAGFAQGCLVINAPNSVGLAVSGVSLWLPNTGVPTGSSCGVFVKAGASLALTNVLITNFQYGSIVYGALSATGLTTVNCQIGVYLEPQSTANLVNLNATGAGTAYGQAVYSQGNANVVNIVARRMMYLAGCQWGSITIQGTSSQNQVAHPWTVYQSCSTMCGPFGPAGANVCYSPQYLRFFVSLSSMTLTTTPTNLPFSSVQADPMGGWSLSTYQWTVPATGAYSISVALTCTGANSEGVFLTICNGACITGSSCGTVLIPNSGAHEVTTITCTLYLTQTSSLYVLGSWGGGTTTCGYNGGAQNYFTAQFIGV